MLKEKFKSKRVKPSEDEPSSISESKGFISIEESSIGGEKDSYKNFLKKETFGRQLTMQSERDVNFAKKFEEENEILEANAGIPEINEPRKENQIMIRLRRPLTVQEIRQKYAIFLFGL